MPSAQAISAGSRPSPQISGRRGALKRAWPLPSPSTSTTQGTMPTVSSSPKATAPGSPPRSRSAEQHRRPDRRMAGEGQLAAGREDAQARAVPRLVGRQHEHGLGQVELAGDRLHRRGVEPFGIEHHRERVAGERPIGEHVEGDEASGHGASWRPPLPEGEGRHGDSHPGEGLQSNRLGRNPSPISPSGGCRQIDLDDHRAVVAGFRAVPADAG